MTERTYEDAADEYDGLSFYQSMARFSASFSEVSLGELMALGGRFLELAHGASEAETDEQDTAQAIAQAIEEVIVFRMKANPSALQKYLDAKRKHIEHLQSTLSTRRPSSENPSKAGASKSLLAWFGRKR